MRNIRSMLVTGAAVAAAVVGGGAIANAATSSSSTPSSSSSAGKTPAAAPPNFPAHGTAAHEDAEKTVTGAAADKAKAAAVKYLGGGTATEVTTDYTGNGYEVDVTKNGSTTEVHLDSSFNVRSGPGDTHGGPSGPPQSGSTGSYGPTIQG
jgi:hypothetical protein